MTQALAWPHRWQHITPDLAPQGSQLHVWAIQPSAARPQYDALYRLLNHDERRKAQRFHFERDRLTYVIARGLLRRQLGCYLQVDPDAIRFGYTAYDKPFISDPKSSLQFNVSHSGDVVLLAFADDAPVGIDVELIRPIADAPHIVARFFSPTEIATWHSLPDTQKTAAFYTCWTRKEAYIKARGEGLSHPLDQFDVTLRPDEPAVLKTGRSDETWTITTVPIPHDYAAALVFGREKAQLACFLIDL